MAPRCMSCRRHPCCSRRSYGRAHSSQIPSLHCSTSIWQARFASTIFSSTSCGTAERLKHLGSGHGGVLQAACRAGACRVCPARGFFVSGTIFLESIVGERCDRERSNARRSRCCCCCCVLPAHARRVPMSAPVCLQFCSRFGSTKGRLKGRKIESGPHTGFQIRRSEACVRELVVLCRNVKPYVCVSLPMHLDVSVLPAGIQGVTPPREGRALRHSCAPEDMVG